MTDLLNDDAAFEEMLGNFDNGESGGDDAASSAAQINGGSDTPNHENDVDNDELGSDTPKADLEDEVKSDVVVDDPEKDNPAADDDQLAKPNDDANTKKFEHPEHVPYGRFKQVNKNRRDAERGLKKTQKELQKERQEAQELRDRLEAYERQAEADDYELRDVPAGVSDELISKMREGDPDAIADYAEIQRKAVIEPEQSSLADDAEVESSWIDAVEDEQVITLLDFWQGDDSDEGRARMEIALEIEADLASDPTFNELSADDIGKKLIGMTMEKIAQQAEGLVADKKASADDAKRFPDSLGDAGGVVGAGKVDPMGLTGQAAIDALDEYLK